ncbi:MAG: SLATT domain-containing protein [Alkalispirochaeta sp.]
MLDETNLSVIRQNFANVVYTKTMHEICKEKEFRKRNRIIYADIALVTLSLVAMIFQAFYGFSIFASYLGMLFSILAITLLLIKLNFDPSSAYRQHERAANDLYEVREKYINLMADILQKTSNQDSIIGRRDELVRDTKRVYDTAPFRDRASYREAQMRLKKEQTDGEDFTFSDEEIDRFLPSELRISTNRDHNRLTDR